MVYSYTGASIAVSSTSARPQTGTVVTIVLIIIGIIGFLTLSFALLRCYHIRRNSKTRDVESHPKYSRRFVNSADITPRIGPTMEMHDQGLLEAAAPPSYIDAISAQNTPALTYCPSPDISRSTSPALLLPHSPSVVPSAPSSPQPAATSPLLAARRWG